MSILVMTAKRIIHEYPIGSIQRVNMMRVVELSEIRFANVQITLETFDDAISRLKDKEIQALLNRVHATNREKALNYIKTRIKDLEEIKKELKK